MILDGKKVSECLWDLCHIKHQRYVTRYGRKVSLGVIWIGDNPASATYIRHKKKMAESLGMECIVYHFVPEHTTEKDIVNHIHEKTPLHDGMIVQLPIPYEKKPILEAIPVTHDVDGLHPYTRFMTPCTPLGCIFLLRFYGIDVKGKHVVVVGRSTLVGKPLADLLLQQHATVTTVHSHTKDISLFTRQADMVCVAAGQPHLLTPGHVKRTAVVIDVGIHNVEGRITGDVEHSVYKHVRAYTPVPGGVGPMTVISLMWNTLYAAYHQVQDLGFSLEETMEWIEKNSTEKKFLWLKD